MNNHGLADIALCNPKNASNAGAILRACNCFGARQVYYTGQRIEYSMRFDTATNNVQEKIPFLPVSSLVDAAEPGQKKVAVELVVGATPLPEFQHPERALYIFGPEDGSLDQATVDACDEVVYIPTTGCLNLSMTVNILLYDRIAKQTLDIDHTDTVKNNRDVNNRLRVK